MISRPARGRATALSITRRTTRLVLRLSAQPGWTADPGLLVLAPTYSLGLQVVRVRAPHEWHRPLDHQPHVPDLRDRATVGLLLLDLLEATGAIAITLPSLQGDGGIQAEGVEDRTINLPEELPAAICEQLLEALRRHTDRDPDEDEHTEETAEVPRPPATDDTATPPPSPWGLDQLAALLESDPNGRAELSS